MEYLILGLLILSPMTGYELRQFIRQNLALICSDSAGSVQTALAKLGREGFVTSSESAGGRRKKTYSITEIGQAAFSEWVAQPMQAERAKNMELSRLFFLGLAKPGERAAAIRDYIRQMEPDVGHSLRHPGALPRDADRPAPARAGLGADLPLPGPHH